MAASTRRWGPCEPGTGIPSPIASATGRSANERRGPEYEQRLPAFCQAMKRADPAIELLSSYPTPGVLARPAI